MPLSWHQAHLVSHPEEAIATEGSPTFRDGTEVEQRAKPERWRSFTHRLVQDDVEENDGGKARGWCCGVLPAVGAVTGTEERFYQDDFAQAAAVCFSICCATRVR
jgi:hypothetical protein